MINKKVIDICSMLEDEDYGYAKKEFKEVFRDISEYDKDTFILCLYNSIMLDEFDNFVDKFRGAKKEGLDNILVYNILSSYINNDLTITELSNLGLDNLDKSIICYIYYRYTNNIKYLQDSYNLSNRNMSSAVELYKQGYSLSLKAQSEIFKLDSDLFKMNKAKEVKPFNFHVLGGGDEIGRSCYICEFDSATVMIDCGIKIDKGVVEYPNFDKYSSLIKKLDIVIITHAHLDHCGAIIELYRRNNMVKFLMTNATKSLIELNLKGSGNIENIDLLPKVLNRCMYCDYNSRLTLRNGLGITLYRAGHILGASSILLSCDGLNILATGDYCISDQNTVKGLSLPPDLNIDYLITENTYANKDITKAHSRIRTRKLLIEKIKTSLVQGKTVIIPAFALGRTQEILSEINKTLGREISTSRLYIDGLSRNATELYSELTGTIFNGINVNDNVPRDEFIRFSFSRGSKCVVCSSGMVQEGSASYSYVKEFIEDSNAVIILTGYQVEGSIGSQLKATIGSVDNEYIYIDGRVYNIKCEVVDYSLSAHCYNDEILALVQYVYPSAVILVHGNEDNTLLYNKLKDNVNTILIKDNTVDMNSINI